MIPILTIQNAIKYLEENTPPEFRNQGRMNAFALLGSIYKQFVAEHEKERPRTLSWRDQFKRPVR